MNQFLEHFKVWSGEKKDTEQLQKEAEAMCNTLLFHPDPIIDDIMKDEELIRKMEAIAVSWVLDLQQRRKCRQYDDRLEYAVMISEALGNPVKTGKSDLQDGAVEFTSLYMHPTLRQTFSGLIFLFIERDGLYDTKEVTEKYWKEWYCVPFI